MSNKLADLFETELAAAHEAMDRKERELDEYGYGRRGTSVKLSPSGLPAPGQGKCRHCGHYALVHGNGKCHHMDEWEGNGPAPMSVYCECSGFEPFADGAVRGVV